MSNISVDYDVLNQRGSPAWFSDVYANIPTAGYKGRMFISTDTYAFYRDTGTGWDLIGGPGTGTITGSGATGQVSFFNGSSTLAGNNNLFWDNTNSRLGINTTTPGQPLDIHSTGNTLVQLNNTSTGNSNISFQNQNVAKWRIGNVFSSPNSFDIFNVNANTNALSISSTNILSFIGVSNFDEVIRLKQNLLSYATSSGYTTMFSTTGGGLYTLGFYNGGGALSQISFTTAASYSYVFPSASGTIALTSNLSSYVPYSGATTNLDLGANPLSAGISISINGTTNGGYLGFKQFSSASSGLSGYTSIFALGTNTLAIQFSQSAGVIKGAYFSSSLIPNNTIYNYNLPSADGTLALTSDLSSYLPLSGGTLTGQLYINPTNTAIVGLDVASNTTRIRSDNLEGFKRQLEITMGSGTLVQLTAKGYGGTYGTDLAFYTSSGSGVNSNPAMYINGGNNIGFGTGSPTTIGTGYTTLGINGTNGGGLTFMINGASANSYLYTASDGFNFINVSGSYLFYNGGSERMRLTNSGNLCIGYTTDAGYQLRMSGYAYIGGNLILNGDMTMGAGAGTNGQTFVNPSSAGAYQLIGHPTGTGTGYSYTIYQYAGSSIGGINQLGTTGVQYNVTSDYRLKENITPIDNAINKILNVKAVKYKWKNTENEFGEGFIAHELQEIIPYAVSGIKDAINKDGTYKLQQVDYSKLVPTLVKAFQELNEKLIRNNIN